MKRVNNVGELSKLITELDEKSDGKGKQLSNAHATKLSWILIKRYRINKLKSIRHTIVNDVNHYRVGPLGNTDDERGSFTMGQIRRGNKVIRELFKDEYLGWWPWSSVNKNFKRLC